jgi:hypothetical protein
MGTRLNATPRRRLWRQETATRHLAGHVRPR